MSDENTLRIVEDAERLIDAKEFPTALWRLRLAAGNVDTDAPDASYLFERIRDGASAVAWADPRYEKDAQAVWDIVSKRETPAGETPSSPRRLLTASRPAAGFVNRYDDVRVWIRVTEVVSDLAILAAVLSFIGGIIVGAMASRYSDGYETHYHPGAIFVGLVGAALSALAWVAVAAVLKVLVYLAHTQERGEG